MDVTTSERELGHIQYTPAGIIAERSGSREIVKYPEGQPSGAEDPGNARSGEDDI